MVHQLSSIYVATVMAIRAGETPRAVVDDGGTIRKVDAMEVVLLPPQVEGH